jgi:hypothetical protein
MGRVVERLDNFLAGWGWWYIDIAAILVYCQGRLDVIVDRLDWIGGLIGGQVTDAINSGFSSVVDQFESLPAAANGMVVSSPTLVRVGEVPEAIIPLSQLGSVARTIERVPDSPGRSTTTTSGPSMVSVNIEPVLIDKGDKWMLKFIQRELFHGGLRVPLAAVGG